MGWERRATRTGPLPAGPYLRSALKSNSFLPLNCMSKQLRRLKAVRTYSRIFCLNRKLRIVLIAIIPARNTIRAA
jgi:hypothetical protein